MNLQLSFRGSERQPPSVLTLARTFSACMQHRNECGTHDAKMNTEGRLRLVVEEYHSQPGMVSRWKVDDEKLKACLNLITGTSSKARAILQCHLNFHKWQQSSLTAELLRSSRWLIGASPRYAKDSLKVMLTVTENAQVEFLQNHVHVFNAQARKVRASARAKLRPSQSDWDKLMDYTCVMEAVKQEVAAALDDQECRDRVLGQVATAFMSRQDRIGLRVSYVGLDWVLFGG